LRHSLWQPPRHHGEQPHERVELHGHEDARARNTFLLQILVLVALGAFIPEAGGARGAAFAVAAGVLFAMLAVLWRLAARGDRPAYHRSSRMFVAGTAACAILLAATALIPAIARTSAWGLIDAAYLAGFAALILTATPAEAAALTITDALIERHGGATSRLVTCAGHLRHPLRAAVPARPAAISSTAGWSGAASGGTAVDRDALDDVRAGLAGEGQELFVPRLHS
jgi:hypothetical protein